MARICSPKMCGEHVKPIERCEISEFKIIALLKIMWACQLDGKACPFCRGDKYHLILRPDVESQPGGIYARCSQCQRTRGVDEDLV